MSIIKIYKGNGHRCVCVWGGREQWVYGTSEVPVLGSSGFKIRNMIRIVALKDSKSSFISQLSLDGYSTVVKKNMLVSLKIPVIAIATQV